jgi:hypothetical protein
VAGAGPLRDAVWSSALWARGQQEALLEIEEALEGSIRERLEGKKSIEAPKTLKSIRARLKL